MRHRRGDRGGVGGKSKPNAKSQNVNFATGKSHQEIDWEI